NENRKPSLSFTSSLVPPEAAVVPRPLFDKSDCPALNQASKPWPQAAVPAVNAIKARSFLICDVMRQTANQLHSGRTNPQVSRREFPRARVHHEPTAFRYRRSGWVR